MRRQVLREFFRLYNTVDSNRHTSQEFSCSHPTSLPCSIILASLAPVVSSDLASVEQRSDGEVTTATTGDVHEEVEPIRSDNEFEDVTYDVTANCPFILRWLLLLPPPFLLRLRVFLFRHRARHGLGLRQGFLNCLAKHPFNLSTSLTFHHRHQEAHQSTQIVRLPDLQLPSRSTLEIHELLCRLQKQSASFSSLSRTQQPRAHGFASSSKKESAKLLYAPIVTHVLSAGAKQATTHAAATRACWREANKLHQRVHHIILRRQQRQ